MKIVILNFSNIYLQEDFYQNREHITVDCSDVDGTNCYCDDEALATITSRIKDIDCNGIHFIDSGNFHYLSKLWTDKITENFNLLVFDHHTDMQEPQFGDILSCGGWIKKVLDENKNINKVFLLGVRNDLAKQIPPEYEDKVECINESSICECNLEYLMEKDGTLPLYISIDKDALCEDDAITNWDQGTMTLQQTETIISAFAKKCKILGIDVCGEPNTEDTNSEANTINNRTNAQLIEFLNQLE